MEANLEEFDRQLNRLFPDFQNYPSNLRLACFDMIYNSGIRTMQLNYVKFVPAIRHKQWDVAARESHRKPPITEPRNDYVRGLLMKQYKLDRGRE